MKMQPKASHFINGRYIEDTAGEVIEVLYPATGEVIARLHAATPAIIDEALIADADQALHWMKEDMLLGYLDVFPNAPTAKLVEGGVGPSWGLLEDQEI